MKHIAVHVDGVEFFAIEHKGVVGIPFNYEGDSYIAFNEAMKGFQIARLVDTDELFGFNVGELDDLGTLALFQVLQLNQIQAFTGIEDFDGMLDQLYSYMLIEGDLRPEYCIVIDMESSNYAYLN